MAKTIQLWGDLRRQHGDEIIIATRRNCDATALNKRAREVLRAEDRLFGADIEAPSIDREDKSASLALSAGDQVRFGENLAAYGIRNGTPAKVAEIRQEPDGAIHAAFELDGGRGVEGVWTSFAAARRGRKPLPPRIVHAYAGTVYAAQGRTVPGAVLHLANPTDAREIYVGLTRHTQDTWVVVESARLDAICRRRQSDPRIKPTTNDLHERLFREARQYGEKRNVVDFVADRVEFAWTGIVRTPSDEKAQGFARYVIESTRAFQRALAWLRETQLRAPAWIFMERTRARIRDLPLALREIVTRRAPSMSPSREQIGSAPISAADFAHAASMMRVR